ncbi:exodeoxyribonuclease VII large subunit [Luteipulveratus mongoliensis]|uniref:Exodeoxyribonuclease 7 large subunit n=1 Tax=Luteipulveratus mongoliensis TaxID=571913 RepID=A0A0K1JMA1_9MICO|nr:exodeoxyribonuclease VII large subunit [Luteipulveratus mongoliensis]AKU17703.1 exodeoxyribonuclease VII large subunit [Luteipulveratus mongoliensis]
MSTPLPERAADTTAEQPWPVRTLSLKIADYVDKMAPLWVEGQVVQLNRRPGTCYLTLRDTEVDLSLSVTVPGNTLDAMGAAVREGARVVVHAKPTFWTKRGTLHLDARQIKPVGVGELLARLEHLKQLLRSEGLFDASRKQRLPFLPRRVGLITGRAGAAEKDVVQNARRRWPATQFVIRQVAVQGPDTVREVSEALRELDQIAEVDVIVIARGGGSFEDLLAFSNESLVRAVSGCRTPVVSAIGHDVDTPLLDFVADVRASTPTDAAKQIVPDLREQLAGLTATRERARRAVHHRFAAERRHLEALRSRPVLADPHTLVTTRRREIDTMRERAAYRLRSRIERATDQVAHLRAQVRSLSPLSTLERGYAVVRHAEGGVVMDPSDLDSQELLSVTVAQGAFDVRSVS